MWTFSTLCPSFLSGVVREVDYSQDYTRDASCTHVLHNCAVLISDRVPQVPSLPCKSESRSLSSFLKLEKCCWGPAYWNFVKEHLAGTLPNHRVTCTLQSTPFWKSLYVEFVRAFCIKSARVTLPLWEVLQVVGGTGWLRRIFSVRQQSSPGCCSCPDSHLLPIKDGGMCSPGMSPLPPFQEDRHECSSMLRDGQEPMVRILMGQLRQAQPCADSGAS